MKAKVKKKKKQVENPCKVCGKEVRWGQDGCPVVSKGNELGVLFGSWKYMLHYKCDTNQDVPLSQ